MRLAARTDRVSRTRIQLNSGLDVAAIGKVASAPPHGDARDTDLLAQRLFGGQRITGRNCSAGDLVVQHEEELAVLTAHPPQAATARTCHASHARSSETTLSGRLTRIIERVSRLYLPIWPTYTISITGRRDIN